MADLKNITMHHLKAFVHGPLGHSRVLDILFMCVGVHVIWLTGCVGLP